MKKAGIEKTKKGMEMMEKRRMEGLGLETSLLGFGEKTENHGK